MWRLYSCRTHQWLSAVVHMQSSHSDWESVERNIQSYVKANQSYVKTNQSYV